MWNVDFLGLIYEHCRGTVFVTPCITVLCAAGGAGPQCGGGILQHPHPVVAVGAPPLLLHQPAPRVCQVPQVEDI